MAVGAAAGDLLAGRFDAGALLGPIARDKEERKREEREEEEEEKEESEAEVRAEGEGRMQGSMTAVKQRGSRLTGEMRVEVQQRWLTETESGEGDAEKTAKRGQRSSKAESGASNEKSRISAGERKFDEGYKAKRG